MRTRRTRYKLDAQASGDFTSANTNLTQKPCGTEQDSTIQFGQPSLTQICWALSLFISLTTLASTSTHAQGVQMNFCDQTILDDPFADSNAVSSDPFADSKSVLVPGKSILVSGFSPIQESDFEPKSDSEVELKPILKPQPDDLTDELKQSTESQTDNAIEMLEPDFDKKEQGMLEPIEQKEQGMLEPIEEKKEQLMLEPIDEEEKKEGEQELLLDPAEEKEEKDDQDPIEKLGSDDPVKPPTFDLKGESSDEPSADDEPKSESSGPVQQNFSDEAYQLPTVADVRSPISAAPLSSASQSDPGGLLQNDQSSVFQQRYFYSTSNYADITGMPSAAKFKAWQAHNVYHRPTYFEDQNLELNGNRRAYQNVASAVSFFGTIPRLPYLFGEHHPQEKIFTFGEDRPGNPAPFRIYQQTDNRKGRVLQTIATLGLVLP